MDSKTKAASIAYHMLERAISEIDNSETPDIYVLSFYIYDIEDDPRLPTLTLGYNTYSNYEDEISNASGKDEAKWNYAFWLQNELSIVGESGTQSAAAITSWINDLGLLYSDEDEQEDFDQCLEQGESITKHFIELAIELAQKLHASGLIQKKFKQAIPIFIHELEYYDEIVRQTQRANPPGLTQEFLSWVQAM